MSTKNITKQEVLDAQKAWGEGIVKIGKALASGEHVQAAENHIKTLYAYDISDVLFKPTLASEKQYRPTFEDALSYFVGKVDGKLHHAEDGGFAIKPWTNVRWEDPQIIADKGALAVAMGNYYFTYEGAETKVEYTFAYTKDDNGNVRIVLHHSSLPYTP